VIFQNKRLVYSCSWSCSAVNCLFIRQFEVNYDHLNIRPKSNCLFVKVFKVVQFVLFILQDGGSLLSFPSSTVDPFSGRQRSPFITRSATIGGSSILDCDLTRQSVFNLRDGEKSGKVGNLLSAEHILTWRRQGKEVPIFIQFNGYPPHIDEQYVVSNWTFRVALFASQFELHLQ